VPAETVDVVFERLAAAGSHVQAGKTYAKAYFQDRDAADRAVGEVLPIFNANLMHRPDDCELYYRYSSVDTFKRRIETAKRRAKKPASGSQQAREVEYLYDWGLYDGDFDLNVRGGYCIDRFQILRKTKKYLFVTKEAAGWLRADTWDEVQNGEWRVRGTRWEHDGITLTDTIRLDRAKIEAGQTVWHHPSRKHLCKDLSDLKERMEEDGQHQRACPPYLLESLQALGLSWPTDAEQVKTAYRQLARQHHPDRNVGDPEATGRFKEVQEAYEQLRAFVKESNHGFS
jgi:DnaJ-domain-containing protein 1